MQLMVNMSRRVLRRLLWLIGICLFLAGLGSVLPAQALPVPERHLSTAELQNPLQLSGSWYFRGPDGQSQLVTLPSGWEKYYHRHRPYFGKAEYQLRLQFPAEALGQVFQLNTEHVGGGHFRVWANGQIVGHNGKDLQSLSRRPVFKPFVLKQRQVELRFEVENNIFPLSGLTRPLWLGSSAQITEMRLNFLINRNLILGIFIFVGIGYFILYFFLLRDKVMLWFGVVCLFGAMHAEFHQVHNIETLFGDLPLALSVPLMRAGIAGIFPSFLWYIYYLSQEKYISRRFVFVFALVSSLMYFLTVLIPRSYVYLIGPWFVIVFLCIGYNLYLMLRYVRSPGSKVFIVSGGIFVLSLLNDLCNALGLIQTVRVARYGLLCFCFAQVGLLAVRFQKAYEQALQLQHELKEVNHNLDQLVSSRTSEVRSKHQELQQLVQFKDEMTQMLVHDLKTPLNALLNLPQSAYSHLRQELQAISGDMLKRIDSLLLVKHSAAAGLQLKTEAQPLAPLIEKSLKGVQAWATGKKITLSQEQDAQVVLMLDRDLFERVLQNLLDNALKQTPVGGSIRIGSQQMGEVCQIWVSDTGPGIAPDHLSRVFDKNQSFAQPNTPRSSGLGLYFCRQVVEAHGGQISAENLAAGGCRFLIRLPISEPEPLLALQPSHFAPEQIALLRPVADKLSGFKVYALSQIRGELKKMPASQDPLVQAWRHAVEYAVQEVNEETYADLIAQITQYSDR